MKTARRKKRGAKKARAIVPPKAPMFLEESKPPDFPGYQLGVKLGRGAFGSVYEGLDTTTGRTVAIKTISLDKAGGALAGVQQEIDLMKGLNHEHIIQYIDSYSTQEFLYIAMEFADGGSLMHVQKRFGNPFSERLVATYLYQVLQGLAYLHSQSIIHRDIKAANILLHANVAKLADFGISIKFDDAKRADQNMEFSAYWSAPEVVTMDPINELCDVWSIGITAIELFAGHPPYFDLAPIPAAFRITRAAQPTFPEGASPEFQDFLDCCLKRDPPFRKSAAQLLQHRFIRKHAGTGSIPRPLEVFDCDSVGFEEDEYEEDGGIPPLPRCPFPHDESDGDDDENPVVVAKSPKVAADFE
jgi:serine/threonine protein kinase